MKPLAIDLCCGLGGWTEGLLAEGYEVIGFDIERHEYGEERYPGQLVIQDIRTLHGSQFKDAALIVASPPCQEFSYMAMPWQRGKQIARALRGQDEFPPGYRGSCTIPDLTALFDACFRIQREASAAAGRHIPLVVENVRGAEPWVGRARWSFGSYYLWGDVPALMPKTLGKESVKVGGLSWCHPDDPKWRPGQGFNTIADRKNRESGRRTAPGNGARFTSRDCGVEGRKGGGDWFGSGSDCSLQRRAASASTARKAASAKIAKIPFALSSWIARTYYPERYSQTAAHADNRPQIAAQAGRLFRNSAE